MSYEHLFLYSLFITLIIEVNVLFLLTKYIYKLTSKWDIFLSGILASALTLPYFWFILPIFVPNRVMYIIVGETAIILIEALIYFKLLKLKFWQALVISLIANSVSILIGLLII